MSEKGLGASHYAEIYASWKRDPEGFWADAARDIDWIEQPKRIFDASPRHLRPLVRGRGDEYLLQLPRPACGARARCAAGRHLR